MPFVRITVLGPTLTTEQTQRLHSGATNLMVSVMGKARDGVATLVEIPEGAWRVAGEAVGVGAHVEATVGAQTNTAEEKARFIAEMWTLLRSTLGPELREATYIVVRDTDHGSYGRGGVTRAERDRRAHAT